MACALFVLGCACSEKDMEDGLELVRVGALYEGIKVFSGGRADRWSFTGVSVIYFG
jgi:hypothetical protein